MATIETFSVVDRGAVGSIRGAQIALLGRNGFLGSAIARSIPDATTIPGLDTKVVINMLSHRHMEFYRNTEVEVRVGMQDHIAMLELCSRIGATYIYASSALVYEPETKFSAFKESLETVARCYDCYSVGLRMFPVYGPGDTSSIIAQLFRSALDREPVEIYGDGEQERSFVFVGDIVRAIMEIDCKRTGEDSEVITIAGETVSFNHLIGLMNSLGFRPHVVYVPAPEGYRIQTAGAPYGSYRSKTSIRSGLELTARGLGL